MSEIIPYYLVKKLTTFWLFVMSFGLRGLRAVRSLFFLSLSSKLRERRKMTTRATEGTRRREALAASPLDTRARVHSPH